MAAVKNLGAAILAACCLIFSGCGDARELDDMSYVLTIGIDKSDEADKNIYSYRIAVPKVFMGEGGGDDKEKTRIVSVKSPSLTESLKDLSMAMNRPVELSHASALFVSERVARDGIENAVSVMMNSPIYRNSIIVLVTKQAAREVLEKNTAPFEIFQYRWADSMKRSQNFIAAYDVADIRRFYVNMHAPAQTIFTGMGAINEKTLERASAPPLKDSRVPQYLPATLPREGGTELVVAGSAIFKNWQLVGSLSSSEAMGGAMLREDVRTVTTIAAPRSNDKLSIGFMSKKPDISARLIDGRMYINVAMAAEFQAEEFTKESHGDVAELEEAVSDALKENIAAYFAATRLLGADGLRLSDYCRASFASYEAWAGEDWSELYKNAAVSVEVKARLKRRGLTGRQGEEEL
jgi:spore germination protein KC